MSAFDHLFDHFFSGDYLERQEQRGKRTASDVKIERMIELETERRLNPALAFKGYPDELPHEHDTAYWEDYKSRFDATMAQSIDYSSLQTSAYVKQRAKQKEDETRLIKAHLAANLLPK